MRPALWIFIEKIYLMETCRKIHKFAENGFQCKHHSIIFVLGEGACLLLLGTCGPPLECDSFKQFDDVSWQEMGRGAGLSSCF